MKKSLYSMMLLDDVVREIDRIAYLRNTNRSNLINQILAEYISYTTPEQRIGQILSGMRESIEKEEELQSRLHPSETSMVIRSSIRYRYNPVIHYSIELGRYGEEFTVWIKAQTRTQNQKLLEHLNIFFRLWGEVEKQYRPGNSPYREIASSTGDGRFGKHLLIGLNAEPRETGLALGSYIEAMDRAMKIYFENLDRSFRPDSLAELLREVCEEQLRKPEKQ